MNVCTHLITYRNMKEHVQVRVLPNTARTLKAQAAFEGLNTSELAENMILHCLTNDALLQQLVAECHAAKQAAKAA